MDHQQGEYDRLIRPIEDQMIRSVWRVVRCEEDAEDAFQEALESIWKQLPKISNHPNPHALILRICVNSAINILRQRKKRGKQVDIAKMEENLPDSSPTPAQQAMTQSALEEILSAIGQLPRTQAQAVLMRLVQNSSYTEIAQSMDCRVCTARSHVARGRKKLSKILAHLAPAFRKDESDESS